MLFPHIGRRSDYYIRRPTPFVLVTHKEKAYRLFELRQKTLVLTNVFKNEMLVCTWTLPFSEVDKFVPHFDRNPDAVSHSECPHLTSHKHECFERLQGALIPAFPSRGTPARNATSSGILKSRILACADPERRSSASLLFGAAPNKIPPARACGISGLRLRCSSSSRP